MEYDYSFTKEEEILLYKELKNLINSAEYKYLRNEYHILLNQISKNINSLNFNDPFSIAYLLKKEIDKRVNYLDNSNLDLDILFKLWGSRVCTNNFSNRHIVSFINDLLINSGFLSCKIIANEKYFNMNLINDLINKNPHNNTMLLCLFFDNKRAFLDIDKKELLIHNKLISFLTNRGCYFPINNSINNIYVLDDLEETNYQINDDHLFTLNEYYFLDDFKRKVLKERVYYKDYISFLDDFDSNLLHVKYDNMKLISLLNEDITKKQNEIYKRIKRIN